MRGTMWTLVLVVTIGVLGSPAARAGESALEEAPPAESAKEVETSLDRGFQEAKEPPTLFPRLKRFLDDQPPFLRDARLLLHLRSYWREEDPPAPGESEAIAYGGWLGLRSGEWEELFSVGATLYTTQRLYGPDSKGGTGLLSPGQHGFSALGEAWAKLRVRDHQAVLYRQSLDLPYVNRRDSRMVPQTFEGYTLRGKASTVAYAAGYLSDIKTRDSDHFVSMSEAAGIGERDEGMLFAGLRWRPSEELMLGGIEYWVADTLNIAYAEVDSLLPLEGPVQIRLAGQFTDQRSVGRDLLTGGSFDTRSFGVRATLSYEKAILSLAFTSTDDEEGIRSPWGSDPSFLARMQKNFNRAGEDAWGVGVSYHLDRLGLRGVSGVASYTSGRNARNPATGLSQPDQEELDLTLDYRLKEGRLRGLWFRARAAFLEQDPGGTTTDFRLILNYDIPLL